tara:strand:- start:204 stop:410 length:207 start_codon:yes stop_codon:yes gene_type:complete
MSSASELRQKSDDEIAEDLDNLKREQLNLRFQRASGQLEATNRVKEVRREIARISTIINERRHFAENN